MIKDTFIKLNMEERAEFLWRHGEVVFEKTYYDCDIRLFLLGDFYAEVFFNRVVQAIVSVEVQDNTQILYGYIKDLDLSDLLASY